METQIIDEFAECCGLIYPKSLKKCLECGENLIYKQGNLIKKNNGIESWHEVQD